MMPAAATGARREDRTQQTVRYRWFATGGGVSAPPQLRLEKMSLFPLQRLLLCCLVLLALHAAGDAPAAPLAAAGSSSADRRRGVLGGSAPAAGGIAYTADHERILANTDHGSQREALSQAVDVLAYGADPTAAVDSADAFRAALAAAAVSNETRTVYVPPGHYKFLSDIRIPQRVTLQGAMRSVESFAGLHTIPAPFDGSVLEPHHGAGQTNGSFILVDSNSVLTGVIVYYPNQVTGYVKGTSLINVTESLNPIKYPWAIQMIGHNAAVLDVVLHNPYQGIGIGVGGQMSWRHLIRNVQGQPLLTGLFIDNVRDIGRVENVHWLYQMFSAAFLQFQINEGRCFVIGRSDWQYFLNTFCLGYRIGYHFTSTDIGATNGNFLGIAADASLIPVMINATQVRTKTHPSHNPPIRAQYCMDYGHSCCWGLTDCWCIYNMVELRR